MLTNWSTNLVLADNDTNTVTILASNVNNQAFTKVITNFVDTTAPVLAITNPAQGAYIDGTDHLHRLQLRTLRAADRL